MAAAIYTCFGLVLAVSLRHLDDTHSFHTTKSYNNKFTEFLKMWKFLLTSIVASTLPYSHTLEHYVTCNTLYDFIVCIDLSNTIRVVHQLDQNMSLRLDSEAFSSIGGGSFNNLTAYNLLIAPHNKPDSNSCIPTIINYTPESWKGLSSIHTISLKCVALRGISQPFARLNSLINLDFRRNELMKFPNELCAGIPNLLRIHLSHQEIRRLSPASFSGITPRLASLLLTYSNLSYIESHSFAIFRHLTWLELSNNKMEILHSDMFDGLDNLEFLTMAHNRLYEIGHATFSGLNRLEYIDLKDNYLESLHDGIFNDTVNLNRLEIQGNPMKIVHGSWFERLDNLSIMHLGFNEVIEVDPSIITELRKWKFVLTADQLQAIRDEYGEERPSGLVEFP